MSLTIETRTYSTNEWRRCKLDLFSSREGGGVACVSFRMRGREELTVTIDRDEALAIAAFLRRRALEGKKED